MKMIEVGVIDDSETFALFKLFDKLKKDPDNLTPIERIALQGFGIDI